MKLAQILPHLDALAPLRFAEAWDNVGLLTGDVEAPINRVLLTIDTTPAVLAEAQAQAATLVLSYHPLFLKPAKRIGPQDALWQATRAGIAVYSPHTALDAAEGGTNDILADLCGLGARAPLNPLEQSRAKTQMDGAPALAVGAGRIGELEAGQALLLPQLAASLRHKAGLHHVQFALAPAAEGKRLRRVAVAAGAGDSLVSQALQAGADVLVTGEMRHHTLLACMAAGLCVVLLGHDGSERPALTAFGTRLRQRIGGVEVLLSKADVSRLQVCVG